MCTYNGGAFVAEQVRSILAQTHPPAELIVADDGSTDGTRDVVADTIAAYGRANPGLELRVVTLPPEAAPLGVAANFERALRASSFPVIALSDQDDVWHPDRLEHMLAALEAPGVTLVHGDARLVDAVGADLGTTLFGALGLSATERSEIDAGDGFSALLRRNLATGATTLLRTEVRDRALPIPAGWIHDEWLAIVAAATSRTALLDEPLTDYRQHGENQIGVRRASLGDKLSRLREPRQPRNSRLLTRARSLAERLDALDGVPPERRALARAKLAHEARRSALPAIRIARVGGVITGWRSGDYRRFGRGGQDALRDLVQPSSARKAPSPPASRSGLAQEPAA
jgi:glycosyltransferase involved in cell wall biosynthesis